MAKKKTQNKALKMMFEKMEEKSLKTFFGLFHSLQNSLSLL